MPLTSDYAGASRNPMWWKNRIYFLSDRDGTMNLWSMDENGKHLEQHTRQQGFDIKSASLSQGKIVYQLGADLRLYDIASGQDRTVPIELPSDFDNLREHWIKNPIEYLSAVHFSPGRRQGGPDRARARLCHTRERRPFRRRQRASARTFPRSAPHAGR